MKRFLCADDVVEIIENRKNRGYGLQHFKEYMASIGNPHLELKSIHIAGTNGKGSTTNDVRSILQSAGYRVGSFTSPYMITHYDRIRINDCDISEQMFLEISNQYYESWITWDLSMFEIDMCIAVVYFLKEQVDYCVFEVGLGGRLDSTNILEPLVSVITNIGLDHMELLGDTKEKIANEKAGIVKSGIDLLTKERTPSCLAVFKDHVRMAQSELYMTSEPYDVHENEVGMVFSYEGYNAVQLSSHAKYQCDNAALAIHIVTYLHDRHMVQVSEDAIREGLKKAHWIGRFEILCQQPLLLLDGAHNAHGIKALVESLKDMQDIRVIFSVLKDKNFEEMLDILETLSDDIIVTPFLNDRALDVRILQRNSIQYDAHYQHAIDQALLEQKNIVITGSLYFISEVRKYVLETIKH